MCEEHVIHIFLFLHYIGSNLSHYLRQLKLNITIFKSSQQKHLLFDAVISSLYEPFPGWVDNFNGPVGLMIAGGKGFLRTSYADPKARGDYMPVDVCIQFMIIASWYKSVCG
jgi:hypothetical protein